MFKKINSSDVFRTWLPLAIVTTMLCGLLYAAVQYNVRSGANDPQIQMAEDAATDLQNNKIPDQIIPQSKIDISKSLAPFMIIYNQQGQILSSSANLYGKNPILPEGVLVDTKNKGETRFTWQPSVGVRSAVVVKYFGGPNPGFVLAGRSLREIEKREDYILKEVVLGYLVILFLILTSTIILKAL